MAVEIANLVHAMAVVNDSGLQYESNSGFTGPVANPGVGQYNLTLAEPVPVGADTVPHVVVQVTHDTSAPRIVGGYVDSTGTIVVCTFADAAGAPAAAGVFFVTVLRFPVLGS